MKKFLPLLLLTAAGLVQADPVTWEFRDVKFTDGGLAYGSFIYDADTNVYSSVAITTTKGDAFEGAYYEDGSLPDEFSPSSTSVYLSPNGVPAPKQGEFLLSFKSALTNAGGSIKVSTDESRSMEGLCVKAPEGDEKNISCDAGGFVNWLRTVSDGFVSTSPKQEPSD